MLTEHAWQGMHRNVFDQKKTKVSLYGLHRNLQHWGDPDNFRPERFLLDGKVVQVKVLFGKKVVSNFAGSLAASIFHWKATLSR